MEWPLTDMEEKQMKTHSRESFDVGFSEDMIKWDFIIQDWRESTATGKLSVHNAKRTMSF